MRLLLDTHTLLWWLSDDPSLPESARKALRKPGNEVLVSAVSAWEIATKFRLGRLPSAVDLVQDFEGHLQRSGFRPLLITLDHSVRAGLLPEPHRDPFDRMLIAQALAENLFLLSNDRIFDQYGVRRLW